MPALELQTRFLLRGSALLVGMLTLWWFALLTPALFLLNAAAGVFLQIEENPSGDWAFHVPVEKTIPGSRKIHSIAFDMPRADVITFTFSLPVYWAIMLAMPGVKRNLRPLLLGTALMSAVELALLLAFANIKAFGAASQLAGSRDGTWMRSFAEYLVVNVLPYAAPFVVALSLHRELRFEVLAVRYREQAPSRPRFHSR